MARGSKRLYLTPVGHLDIYPHVYPHVHVPMPTLGLLGGYFEAQWDGIFGRLWLFSAYSTVGVAERPSQTSATRALALNSTFNNVTTRWGRARVDSDSVQWLWEDLWMYYWKDECRGKPEWGMDTKHWMIAQILVSEMIQTAEGFLEIVAGR